MAKKKSIDIQVRRGELPSPTSSWTAEELLETLRTELAKQDASISMDERSQKQQLYDYLKKISPETKIGLHVRIGANDHRAHMFWDYENERIAGAIYKGTDGPDVRIP